MDLTPKQQTSEAIRQAESIVIMTGQHPSVDQVTAVIALAGILRKFGKTVTAVVSDNPPASVQALDASTIERGLGGQRDFVLKLDVTKVEVDKLRYESQDGKLNIYLTPFKGSFAPSDVTFGYGESNIQYDLAIVLGVPTRARIDRLYEQNAASFEAIPIVNLDFHRSNENYGAVNLIEPNASSLCEMLVALSESLQSGIIDADIATALLMGIVASTDRFTAAHTSPKSLTVAAQMMAAGARQQAVVRALYRDGKAEARSTERSGGQDRPSAGGDRTERADRPERPERTAERTDRPDRPERTERASDRRDDRSAERPERNVERPERTPERRDDRPERSASQAAPQQRPVAQAAPQPQPQQAQAQPQPQPQTQPAQTQQQPVQPQPVQPQPQDRPEPAPANPVVPLATSTAMAEPDAQEQFDDFEPIIQPGHIELEPQTAVSAPRDAEAGRTGQAEPIEPPMPGRPQSMPMADFAAAAEMFNVDQVANADPKRDES